MISSRAATTWIGLAIVALALAGCAKPPFSVIESKIDGLKGQPIKAVVDKIGEPDDRAQAAAEMAYIWRLNPSNDPYQAIGFACAITVYVDKNGKIAHEAYEGNVGGCAHYAHQLDDSYHFAQGVLSF
jgi:hypothetical protein